MTLQEIEKEIQAVMEKPLCMSNLKIFNELSEAMRNMAHTERVFSEEDANKWVAHMSPKARWNMEQTTAVMRQYGYEHKPCEFFAVMNALYSDYGKTAARMGFDRPDVWAALAHDWIDDGDAVADKVGRYWRDIVKH